MSLRSLLSAEVLIAAPLFMCAPLAATGDSDVERGKDVGAEGGASMYRFPDISDDEIVFVYANDLWRVSDEGGVALPLASPDGRTFVVGCKTQWSCLARSASVPCAASLSRQCPRQRPLSAQPAMRECLLIPSLSPVGCQSASSGRRRLGWCQRPRHRLLLLASGARTRLAGCLYHGGGADSVIGADEPGIVASQRTLLHHVHSHSFHGHARAAHGAF